MLAGPNCSHQTLVDMGFGARANSSDALLRIYVVQLNWAANSVSAANFHSACRSGLKRWP